MRKLVLLSGFSICLLAFVNDTPVKSEKILPLIIFYQPPVPADSVQDFLRVCFTMNKRVVLDTAVRKELLSDHFQKFFKERTDFLKEKGRSMNEAELEEWTNRFMQHPYNHLRLQVFCNNTRVTPETDSIKWQMRIPRMDTSQYKIFIPAPERKEIYASLKDFADTVLASGLLR